MRQQPSNPAGNALSASMNESTLIRAIESSGYPLQGRVAEKLKPRVDVVVEEWGYRDRDTGAHRGLDVAGFKNLGFSGIETGIIPEVTLLIECKRSIHPYVFFQNVSDAGLPVPTAMGLKRDVVHIYQTSDGSSREVGVAQALGLHELPFVDGGPARCAAFSRATLSGSKVELSGEEIFNGLILPLVKAVDHRVSTHTRVVGNEQMPVQLLLAVGVVDAPVILVESPTLAVDPVLTPWVRVVRRESSEEGKVRLYAVDVVHIDYFEAFLDDHLLPFAVEFARRAKSQAGVLRFGGTADDLRIWRWDQVRARSPRTR